MVKSKLLYYSMPDKKFPKKISHNNHPIKPLSPIFLKFCKN